MNMIEDNNHQYANTSNIHESRCDVTLAEYLHNHTQHTLIWEPAEYTIGTVHLLLGILSVACNSCVIWNYVKSNGMRNTTYLLFINLAVSDTITGIIGFHKGFHFLVSREWFDVGLLDDILCRIFAVLLAWMPSVTLVNLSLASFIRAIAILKPLDYKRIITIKLTWGLVIGGWVVSSVSYCILPLILATFKFNFFWASCQYVWTVHHHVVYDVIETLLMYIPLSILIGCNIRTVIYLIRYTCSAKSVGEVGIVLKKMISMTISYLIVYSFVICYDSIMVLRTMGIDSPYHMTIGRLKCAPLLYTYFINWYDLSMLLNSNMNPLIHFIFGREFKRQLTKRMSVATKRLSIVYSNTQGGAKRRHSCLGSKGCNVLELKEILPNLDERSEDLKLSGN